MTPKGSMAAAKSSADATKEKDRPLSDQKNLSPGEFDFAMQMQHFKEKKIQQKLIRQQYLKYKRKRRLNLAEGDFAAQKMNDFLKSSELNRVIVED